MDRGGGDGRMLAFMRRSSSMLVLVTACFASARPPPDEEPAERARPTRVRRIELAALGPGHTEAIACDESGTAYVHVVRAGATVVRELLHVELDGDVGAVDLDRYELQVVAQDPDGGAWALTKGALHHVRWGRVDSSIPFGGGGSQLIEVAPDAVVVLRRSPLGTQVFHVSPRGTQQVGELSGTALVSPVADGRGGLWAVAHDAKGGVEYSGTTPFVHWDGELWRHWLRRDGNDKVALAPPGTTAVDMSPLWTTSPLFRGPDGGFFTLGQRRFVATSPDYQDLLRVDRTGHVVDQSRWPTSSDATFGFDVGDGSPLQLERVHDGAVVTRMDLVASRVRRQHVRAPEDWRPLGPVPSHRACASGRTVWVTLENAIVGESGPDRVEFVAP